MPMFNIYINDTVILGITIVVLVIESIVLWRIQQKPFKRFFAWTYIVLLLIVLVALPVLVISEGAPIRYMLRPNEWLYWSCVGIAHLFFVLMLIQLNRKKRQTISGNPANILDDYAEVD